MWTCVSISLLARLPFAIQLRSESNLELGDCSYHSSSVTVVCRLNVTSFTASAGQVQSPSTRLGCGLMNFVRGWVPDWSVGSMPYFQLTRCLCTYIYDTEMRPRRPSPSACFFSMNRARTPAFTALWIRRPFGPCIVSVTEPTLVNLQHVEALGLANLHFCLSSLLSLVRNKALGSWNCKQHQSKWGQRREPATGQGRSRNDWWTYGFVLCRAWRKAGKWILHSVNLFEPSVIPIFKCPYTSNNCSLTTRWVNGNNARRKKKNAVDLTASMQWQPDKGDTMIRSTTYRSLQLTQLWHGTVSME